jgi:hypothetical protein
MMLTKARMIALVVLLAGAAHLISLSIGESSTVAQGASPPCALINRPPVPFGDRLTAHRPAVPLPTPGECEN